MEQYICRCSRKFKICWSIVLAKFPNPGGLEKVGGNYFEESANSGVPVIEVATQVVLVQLTPVS